MRSEAEIREALDTIQRSIGKSDERSTEDAWMLHGVLAWVLNDESSRFGRLLELLRNAFATSEIRKRSQRK